MNTFTFVNSPKEQLQGDLSSYGFELTAADNGHSKFELLLSRDGRFSVQCDHGSEYVGVSLDTEQKTKMAALLRKAADMLEEK